MRPRMVRTLVFLAATTLAMVRAPGEAPKVPLRFSFSLSLRDGAPSEFVVSEDGAAMYFIQGRRLKQLGFEDGVVVDLGKLPGDYHRVLTIPGRSDLLLVDWPAGGMLSPVALVELGDMRVEALDTGSGGGVKSIAPSGKYVVLGVDVECHSGGQECPYQKYVVVSLATRKRERAFRVAIQERISQGNVLGEGQTCDGLGWYPESFQFDWGTDDTLLVTRREEGGATRSEALQRGRDGGWRKVLETQTRAAAVRRPNEEEFRWGERKIVLSPGRAGGARSVEPAVLFPGKETRPSVLLVYEVKSRTVVLRRFRERTGEDYEGVIVE